MRRPHSGWDWFVVGFLAFITLALMYGGYVLGQGDVTPVFQHIPIQAVDTTGANRVNVGDLANHALRVNVVSGSAGGPSGNIGAAVPASAAPAGFRDPSGFLATASITNNNALLVESIFRSTGDVGVRAGDASNNAVRVNVVAGSSGAPSGSIGAAFPTSVSPVGVKDSSGFLASLTTTNGALIVTAPTSIAAAVPTTAHAIGMKDPSGFFASASGTNNNALLVESIFTDASTFTAVRPGDTANRALRVNIVSGSVGITSSNYGAAMPSSGLAVGFSDGTNLVAPLARTTTPSSSDTGLVVRPLMPTNGTQTMPTGDSTSRPIYVSVANGSTVTTDNNALELGATTVAQTNSLNYGSVIRNPSTMTLGNNAMGMRATYGRAGQQIVQMNAPVGDWITGFASMTTTANTQVIAAQVSGVGFCMTDYMIGNLSSTDTYVVFRSGQTDITGYIPVPALGGNNKSLKTPICTASATALNIKAHIAVATVTITVNGYKTKDF